MTWFHHLKIAAKLVATFFVVILLVVLLGIFAIFEVSKVNSASSDIASKWLPSINALQNLELLLNRVRGSDAQQILLQDPQLMVANKTSSDKLVLLLKARQKEYEDMISQEEEKALYVDIRAGIDQFLAVHDKIVSLSMGGQKGQAQGINVSSSAEYAKMFATVEKVVALNIEAAKQSNLVAGSTYTEAKMVILGLLVVCVVLALSLSIWLARLISRPLNEAIDVAQRIADGDLSSKINVVGMDETGRLMHALKAMNDSLSNIVGETRRGIDTIATASNQIATGNLDLSSRTEQQGSSLEKTASALEQLTSTVKQNADNARQANQLATSASKVAVEGGDVVGQVVQTMGAINDSSHKIVDIISVIDGIAFQTNILALNAAVEAARAGEQGRGFAVVASEVRVLAQRSAAAAKEIKTLIDNSVNQVGIGSKLVEQAGVTMREVVDSVKRVTDIVGEITLASQEQSVGIEQINLAVTQMDESTQQNAALVEQAAAAAQSLQEQAGRLSQTVSVFQLGAVQSGLAASKPAASSLMQPTAQKTVTVTRKPSVDITPRKPVLAKSAPQSAVSRLPVVAKTDNDDWEQF
jgi:methyl-accepting chemotaxis protein